MCIWCKLARAQVVEDNNVIISCLISHVPIYEAEECMWAVPPNVGEKRVVTRGLKFWPDSRETCVLHVSCSTPLTQELATDWKRQVISATLFSENNCTDFPALQQLDLAPRLFI